MYRHDSDFYFPYGHVRRLAAAGAAEAETRRVVAGKTKLVAWMVSHCGANSRRDQLVAELQRFLPVDVFGACGQLRCQHCEALFDAHYKFFLAFENTICECVALMFRGPERLYLINEFHRRKSRI